MRQVPLPASLAAWRAGAMLLGWARASQAGPLLAPMEARGPRSRRHRLYMCRNPRAPATRCSVLRSIWPRSSNCESGSRRGSEMLPEHRPWTDTSPARHSRSYVLDSGPNPRPGPREQGTRRSCKATCAEPSVVLLDTASSTSGPVVHGEDEPRELGRAAHLCMARVAGDRILEAMPPAVFLCPWC